MKLIEAVDSAATTLDGLELETNRGMPVHQEIFTRLLERLDGITADDLSDEERAFVRGQRKSLVQRTHQLAARHGQ